MSNDAASFDARGSEESGVSIDFDASKTSDSDGSIVTYEWDWDGDGVDETSTSSATTSHTFETGDHTVSLRVTDDDGATNSTSMTVSAGT